MTREQRLFGMLWFVGVIFFLIVNFSVVFFVTGWIYRLLDLHPSPLLVQIINSTGGLMLGAAIAMSLARLFQPRIATGENRLYGPIIDALERIAKGDFSVRLDTEFDEHMRTRGGVMGNLVKTVNNMALGLDQMESLRQEFISNVSHEIQSPLTSIRGFAQALQNDHLSAEDRHHYLTIIETESIRLSKLSDNLLKLASLESDRVKFQPKVYRLDKQIRNLILACEPQWTTKALEMGVSLDPVEITADEDLLSQVWINLIHNSIKFTPEQGKLAIVLRRSDSQIEFQISDTGPGISNAEQSRIFERFYKGDKSRVRSDTGGSGLGLSIVQKIIALHHGTVTLKSTIGEGTTFFVSLPQHIDPAAPSL